MEAAGSVMGGLTTIRAIFIIGVAIGHRPYFRSSLAIHRDYYTTILGAAITVVYRGRPAIGPSRVTDSNHNVVVSSGCISGRPPRGISPAMAM